MHGSRRSQVLLLQLTPRDSLRTESVKVSVTDQICILRASSSPSPMSTTKTIELPLGNTTARCTIEIPDTSDDPPAPEAVVDFTYQAVAWIVKLAAEMNTTAPATSPQRSSIRQVRAIHEPSACHQPSSARPDEAAMQLIGVKRERQPDCVDINDGSADRQSEAGTVVKRPKLAMRHDSFWNGASVPEVPMSDDSGFYEGGDCSQSAESLPPSPPRSPGLLSRSRSCPLLAS